MPELYRKYRVERNGEVVSDQTMTFTLVPAHDADAVEALYFYADSVFPSNPDLANALYARLDAENYDALPLEDE